MSDLPETKRAEVSKEGTQGSRLLSNTSGAGTAGRARARLHERDDERWDAPQITGGFTTRLGGSVVDQFVAGHDATDVLRELVQNEFDAGGSRMSVTFGTEGLTVSGTGRAIDAGGWRRLSVILGTGRVVGDPGQALVREKRRGIGSKNFGLRSLFLFGNRIHVRSAGRMAVLDLPSLGTQNIPDPKSKDRLGVSVHVPYRTEPFERLAPFDRDAERGTLDQMAGGMLATLVKLSLTGKRPGLTELTLRSQRTGRELSWRQRAESMPCRVRGVSAVRRVGRLADIATDTAAGTRTVTFEEYEFRRPVEIPSEHRGMVYPEYFKRSGDSLYVAVSVPIRRRRIDLGARGHFYYPLQTPHGWTGSAVSVSAPFDLDSDRSKLTPVDWNAWLAREAAALVEALLKGDWTERFGADAFLAVGGSDGAEPSDFAKAVRTRLSESECWPTRSRDRDKRFAKAGNLVIPDEEALEGFLEDRRYLDDRLSASADVKSLARQAGAKPFTVNSLVRLRCAGKDSSTLQTKIKDEADFHYPQYQNALTQIAIQVRFALALAKVARRLTPPNRRDLKESPSTLTADGVLRSASELVLVKEAIWDVCPERPETRLHRSLIDQGALASLCRPFDEERWIVQTCERAALGEASDDERLAVERRLLSDHEPLGRKALGAISRHAVVRDQHGDWAAPADMVLLRGELATILARVVHLPSAELRARPKLLKALRIRTELAGRDLVALAKTVAEAPENAVQLEAILMQNLRLLVPTTVRALADIRFLPTLAGGIGAPADLHLDTPVNRACLADDGSIAAGGNATLLRRLGVKPQPTYAALLRTLARLREAKRPHHRLATFYSEFAAAIARERIKISSLATEALLWVPAGYKRPADVLATARAPRWFDTAVPVVHGPESLVRAYQALGTPQQPTPAHWVAYFGHLASTYGTSGVPSAAERRVVLDAYRYRGTAGLPEGLAEGTRCIMDRTGRLFSGIEIRAGLLLHDDVPELAVALEQAGSTVGFVPASESAKHFYQTLRPRALSHVCGIGEPIAGQATTPPFWFKPHHAADLLGLLHRPIVASAIAALAEAQARNTPSLNAAPAGELGTKLTQVGEIRFVAHLEREYTVAGTRVLVAAEVAPVGRAIAFTRARTKLDLEQLLASALAEFAGAGDAAHIRALAGAILPLLFCQSPEDLRIYLQRMGISRAIRAEDVVSQTWDEDSEDALPPNLGEEIIRNVFQDLDTRPNGGGVESPATTTPRAPAKATPAPPPSPPKLVLPDIDSVTPTMAEARGSRIEPRVQSPGSVGGAGGGWTPPTPQDVERDRQVGARGEAIAYRLELARVRAAGHKRPEDFVIWTSQSDPGADHDIRSIDEKGRPRWIEVKSTTGTDGRFEWSRKEFEKAMREGARLEIWRVYEAHTANPTVKRFVNPAAMLARSELQLELSTLRAYGEAL